MERVWGYAIGGKSMGNSWGLDEGVLAIWETGSYFIGDVLEVRETLGECGRFVRVLPRMLVMASIRDQESTFTIVYKRTFYNVSSLGALWAIHLDLWRSMSLLCCASVLRQSKFPRHQR